MPLSHKNTKYNSYNVIVKSTAYIGGSEGTRILLAILRTKFIAILVGPSGLGLLGLLTSILTSATTILGMGLTNSGIRQVAEVSASCDQTKMAHTVATLRTIALLSGCIGSIVFLLLSSQICKVTFGQGTDNLRSVALLSIAVFFTTVAGAQIALLQGMRSIQDLAKVKVIAALCATIGCIPIIYYWRQDGIVSLLVIEATGAVLASRWYVRRILQKPISVPAREFLCEAKGLLTLGLIFMSTSFMTVASIYLIRLSLVRHLGIELTGLYEASFTLSNVYIGFILQAMGADFYPFLTKIVNNHNQCNNLVNNQIEVGLLLATPALLMTLTFAPFVLEIFYSREFIAAYEVLQWQVLGTFMRVIAWPMVYILLAKRAGKLYFFVELVVNILFVTCTLIAIQWVGFYGTGIAYFIVYIFYVFMTFTVAHYLTGFRLSTTSVFLILPIVLLVSLNAFLQYFIPNGSKYFINASIALLAGMCSLIILSRFARFEQVNTFFDKLPLISQLYKNK